MILVLGNFAGVFSNLLKLICWSIKLKEEDTILFYYTNKSDNNNPRVLPFHDYTNDMSRIFFYKYFEYPTGCSLESFHQANQFEMGFPEISKESLPSFVHPYSNGFIVCSAALYKDPNLPQIRQLYHEHMKKRLQFTPLMQEFIHDDLYFIKTLQAQGKRVLAVFIRWTNHYGSYDVDTLFQEIQEISKSYDYVLPITQIYPFFQRIVALLGDKCIQFPRKYLPDNLDWCRPMSDEEMEEEFRCAIRDVYLASQCDCVLGGSSNLFLGALLWNPAVSFKVFDELSNKNGG